MELNSLRKASVSRKVRRSFGLCWTHSAVVVTLHLLILNDFLLGGLLVKYPELFVLRHGQTEWNVAGKFQGQKNSPLTAKGKMQAQLQYELLSGIETLPKKAFVSPQYRTVHTAQIALGPQIEQKLDDRLKEINFGTWEGKTKPEVKSLAGDDYESGLWHFASPQGETFDDISARVQSFLDELTGPAIIVTHGITSIILRGIYMGLSQLDLLQLPRKQGCIYHLADGVEQLIAKSEKDQRTLSYVS